jgi:hypothetical protein
MRALSRCVLSLTSSVFKVDLDYRIFFMNNNLLKEKDSPHSRKVYRRNKHLKYKKETRSKRLKEEKFGTKITTTQSKRDLKNKDFKQRSVLI